MLDIFCGRIFGCLMRDTLISFPESLVRVLGEGAASDLQTLLHDIESTYLRSLINTAVKDITRELDLTSKRFVRIITITLGCALAGTLVVLMLFVAMFLVFK